MDSKEKLTFRRQSGLRQYKKPSCLILQGGDKFRAVAHYPLFDIQDYGGPLQVDQEFC